LARPNDAVALDLGSIVLERSRVRIDRVRAVELLEVLVLGPPDEEPCHQGRDERRWITTLRLESGPRPRETPGDLVGQPTDRVELVRVSADQPLHPRSDRLSAEDERRVWVLHRLPDGVGLRRPGVP